MGSNENYIELPVFDISKPFDSSSLEALSEACKEWGFFHITNHGISKSLYQKLCLISDHLFSLRPESKLNAGPDYTPRFVASPFFESLRVSGPDFFASAQASGTLLLDHHQQSEFSEILKEYGDKMSELSKRITEILLMSLGQNLDKKFHDSEFGDCYGYLRIINYTTPLEQEEEEEEVEGLGMHTDMSCVTIVYQDQIGGLQVRSKQGQWRDINPCDQTLVVNVGDLMQAWSNDRLRSSEHRVVLRRRRRRLSLAFFWCFEDGKAVYAPEEVVGEEGARAYRPFVCGDYLRFREISGEGVRGFEKVGFTVKDFAGVL